MITTAIHTKAEEIKMSEELSICGVKLRPTFSALVAAEEELGPLFALVERAAAGELKMTEMAALFWHCRVGQDLGREIFCESVAAAGLSACTPVLKRLLGIILGGYPTRTEGTSNG
jgi:Phage tail tube protein, GTA-gp10